MTKRLEVAVIVDAAKHTHRRVVRGVSEFRRQVGNWRLYVGDHPQQELHDLKRWTGDGIIADFDDPKVARVISSLSIPIVGVGSGFGGYDESSSIPIFSSNHRAIGEIAAAHLLEQGLEHFAYYSMHLKGNNGWSTLRAEAFQECITNAGHSCTIFEVSNSQSRRWLAMQHELAAWISSLEKPVGIMAGHDACARHVLEACQTLGVRVPDDVAVIGVNNEEYCDYTIPPLSSVESNAIRLGYEAAALLHQMMAGGSPPQARQMVLPMGVVPRASTTVLAISDKATAAAISYIREHACDPIHVEDVLAKVDLSRSTLEPRFKRFLGHTIHAEIQRVQIERVRQLLNSTDLPILDIAARVGFRYPQYLTTVFRQFTGLSPTEYRRRSRPL
jgi:LacI family transcriptional regulator